MLLLVDNDDSFTWNRAGRTDRDRAGEVMGVRHRDLPVEGVQFHPESVLTPAGRSMAAASFACNRLLQGL